MAIATMSVYLCKIVRYWAKFFELCPSIIKQLSNTHVMTPAQALYISCLKGWPCLPHELKKFWLNHKTIEHIWGFCEAYFPSHLEPCMEVLKWWENESEILAEE